MKITSLAAMALALAVSSAAWAEEAKPLGDAAKETTVKKDEKKSPVDQTLVSPGAAMKVDEEDAIKKLLGESAPAAPGDIGKKLDEVLSRMGSSEGLLKQKDPGEITQEHQSRITADLDFLIEEAKKQEAQSSSSSSSKQQKQQEKNQDKVKSQQSMANKQQPTGTDAATRSELYNGDAEVNPGNPDLREVKDDRWASLPPRERPKITNAVKSDILPDYVDPMKKFFDELAKTNRPR